MEQELCIMETYNGLFWALDGYKSTNEAIVIEDF